MDWLRHYVCSGRIEEWSLWRSTRALLRSLRIAKECWPSRRDFLFRAGDCSDSFPEQAQMLVGGFFEHPFLVAVDAEAFESVFFIDHGSDAVTLDAFGAKLGHIGGAGLHQGKHRNSVDFREGGFEGLVSVGGDAG